MATIHPDDLSLDLLGRSATLLGLLKELQRENQEGRPPAGAVEYRLRNLCGTLLLIEQNLKDAAELCQGLCRRDPCDFATAVFPQSAE